MSRVARQVYWLNQSASRNNTDPKVPLDDNRPKRMFLVLAVKGKTITCCPINTVTGHHSPTLTEHKIEPQKYSWLSALSHILAHSITTLNDDVLDPRPAGSIDMADMDEVKKCIKNHLRL